MKHYRPSFTAVLFAVAGLFGAVTVLMLLIDRRSVAVQNSRPLAGSLRDVPTAWATPQPGLVHTPVTTVAVQEANPQQTMGGIVPRQDTPLPAGPDMLEAATAAYQPAHSRTEMDLPVSTPDEGEFAPWPAQPAVTRMPAQIPHYNPSQISPQDLAQRMGGRASLYPETPAVRVPPGWGMTEPDSPSGIPPIATPAEFGNPNALRARPRVTPARSAPTPRLPIMTNSSSSPELATPDPADIQPTPTPRPTGTRIPVQSNVTPDPNLSNVPPGQRLPTMSNMDLGGPSSGGPDSSRGMTIRDGQVREEKQIRPLITPPSVRPRSDAEPERIKTAEPSGRELASAQPMATPLSNLQERSRAPILPGLLEDEEDQDEKSKVSHAPTGAAALPRNQPSTANQSAGSSTPEKSETGGSPRQPAEAARKKEETEVVARVGKRVLTLADARKRVMAFQGMARGDIDDPEYHRAVRAVAEEWSRQVAMAEEARTRKISVGDRDTSATRANWSDQLGRNPEEVLAAAGFTKEEIQREFTERALARKLVETFFSVRYNDAGLRELYRRSPGRFAPPKFYHLREILIPAAGEVGSESDARAREQAEAVAASARQAGADFPALAARFSRAPTARNGGDLGWFDRSNPAPQAVLDAVRGLNKGEVSAPVRDDEGWRIYQVVDSQTPEASFEVVRDQVAALGRELAEKAALEASQAKHKPQVTLQALPSRAEAIASALAETPAAAEAVAGTAVFQASDGTAAPDDSMTQESSPVGPTRRTSAGATAAASGRPAASATGRRTLRSTSEDLATPIPLDSQSPKVGGLPNLLARVQGQSPDASSARNDQPVNNTVTQRLEDGTQIRASVSVRPRTTAPTTPPRGTGDAVAALPASMRAMGHALLDRAGLTGTEPPAQNLAFINIGPNGSGGAPADSSMQGGSQIPDLSPTELKAAIYGPAGGSLRDGQGQSDVTEEYRGRLSDRTSGNRSGGIGPESGKQIPKGFGEQKDRSVVDLAGETVMKPVQAVRGVVGGALGLLKRDNNRSKR